jgi:acyl-CoA synthetase (AMP-forming)/AMP-acid ligase II
MYLPVCHAFGLKLSLMALASGGRLVLLDSFSPARALRLVSDERVTILPATPTHLTLLLRELDPRSHRVDSLRWIVSAAAALPPDAVEGAYERLGAELLYVYGCSEGFLTQTTDRAEIRAGSVGRQVFRGRAIAPADGSVAILDVEHDVELARGETGEIAFGTSRAVRYWGEPAPAGEARWYRSGDLGRLDDNGRLFVSGRLKEVVNRGGLKVACGEVEAELARHPAVADCAVVATPDAVLGEAICACIVVGDGSPPTLAGVRARLAERLARHKLPDELCVLDALPRSPLGKLDRPALTALVVDGDLPRARQRPAIAEPVAAGDAQAQTNG